MRLRRRRSGDSDNIGGGFLKARVSRQKRGSKEEDEKAFEIDLIAVKCGPPGPLKHDVRAQRSIY